MARVTDTYAKEQRWVRPNLDISHRCILRCPQCIRQKHTSQDQIRRSFDIEDKDFQKILDYYPNITFCGQISDPIYHPNFLNFLRMADEQKKCLRIATNGSGMTKDWWYEAYDYGLGRNAWYFGVDGIDEKSELYRIGSNFKEVWKYMKLGRDLGHNVVWQYIIFGYNEHEVDEAIKIAKEEDFSLVLVNTNRGFNPNNPLLRKNVDFKLTSPDKKHLQERVKKEYWGNMTTRMEHWHKIQRKRKEENYDTI
tara:strand:- start:10268 stop:11023 length:756 start_codon:yes stop_codon:yes gene_type:complete